MRVRNVVAGGRRPFPAGITCNRERRLELIIPSVRSIAFAHGLCTFQCRRQPNCQPAEVAAVGRLPWECILMPMISKNKLLQTTPA